MREIARQVAYWTVVAILAFAGLRLVGWWLTTGSSQDDCDMEYDVGWSGAQETCVGPAVTP